MPLIKRKSQDAFEHNVKAELEAGKPKDQALAVAYSIKRKAKKMAHGGSVAPFEPENRPSSIAEAIINRKKEQKLASSPVFEDDSFEDLNEEAGLKEHYEDDIEMTAVDSHDQVDARDRIANIRKRMKERTLR